MDCHANLDILLQIWAALLAFVSIVSHVRDSYVTILLPFENQFLEICICFCFLVSQCTSHRLQYNSRKMEAVDISQKSASLTTLCQVFNRNECLEEDQTADTNSHVQMKRTKYVCS